MDLIIQKYGGSSVATVAQIESIAQHIKSCKKQKQKIVAVISAMGQHTDELLNQAYGICATPPRREIDMLLTAGERISMALLAIALDKIGIDSISLTGSQCGILTDNTHGNARITSILGDRIRTGLTENKVVIIAGFQGVNPDTREITTLGRGGTDLTAIALTSVLNAKTCQLYKDVSGIMTADPRIVKDAKLLTEIDWATMSELAWSGAGVLHHRGAHLAEKYSIPIEIRPTSSPTTIGTIICGDKTALAFNSDSNSIMESKMETPSITAITHKENQTFSNFEIECEMSGPEILTEILDFLWKAGESPSISRESSAPDGKYKIELLASEEAVSNVSTHLDQIENLTYCLVSETKELSSIHIVGSGFRQDPEMLSKICKLIPKDAALVEIHSKNICVAIPSPKLQATINEFHSNLIK